MNLRSLTESAAEAAIALPARRLVWKYVGGLAPVVIVWMALAGWLAALLYDRGRASDQADEATVREWLDEARVFRQTLPELVKEYVRLRDDPLADLKKLQTKRDEIAEHMRALAEPTRAYVNQLPLFPEVYSLTVSVAGEPDPVAVWKSTVPRPERQGRNTVRETTLRPFGPDDDRAAVRVEYRLHAFNKLQRRDEERQQTALVAGALLVTATALATLFVVRFLRRERAREVARLTAVAEKEQHQRELLQSLLAREESEKKQRELADTLLRQRLESTDLQRRAAEAEKATLEMKSQLYAGIGIMAGSYAHNIKNLLVRPNDLLARCIEADGLSGDQQTMLGEVRSTLGTVTERLQQILRTVRRDPSQSEMGTVDLGKLLREAAHTWADVGRDKWKLRIAAELPDQPLWVKGDPSHLLQALENLVFNARDATFEMRNHLRERARADDADPAGRKQRILDAAAWKGEVTLSARETPDGVELEVRDNGIGMTDEVRRNCLRTHFSTKRDNALYEGYSAGMGLGLSFVAMVLEHHRAALAIDSAPMKGATFRVRFPAAQA